MEAHEKLHIQGRDTSTQRRDPHKTSHQRHINVNVNQHKTDQQGSPQLQKVCRGPRDGVLEEGPLSWLRGEGCGPQREGSTGIGRVQGPSRAGRRELSGALRLVQPLLPEPLSFSLPFWPGPCVAASTCSVCLVPSSSVPTVRGLPIPPVYLACPPDSPFLGRGRGMTVTRPQIPGCYNGARILVRVVRSPSSAVASLCGGRWCPRSSGRTPSPPECFSMTHAGHR